MRGRGRGRRRIEYYSQSGIDLRFDLRFIILWPIACKTNKSFGLGKLVFSLFPFIEFFLKLLKSFVKLNFSFWRHLFLSFVLVWVLTMLFRYIYSLLLDDRLFDQSNVILNHFLLISDYRNSHVLPTNCIVIGLIFG